MLIKRVSRLTKQEHTLDIPVTQDQIDTWQSGVLIQRAMPNVSQEDREFLMSGITPEEWNQIFSDEEK